MQRFRGGPVFKAHRLLYHSTLGLRVIRKRRRGRRVVGVRSPSRGVKSTVSSQFKNNHFTEMCSGSEAGSYLRLIDSFITQRKAQGPSRTCNESKEEEVFIPPRVESSQLCSSIVHRVSSSLLGPVVPSFRALSGCLRFTVRRHKFNKDSLSDGNDPPTPTPTPTPSPKP